MYMAVFCAVRGNLPALTAVLDAVEERGIETVFNAGDSVGIFPWPNEVIALLQQRGIPTVQGVDDRITARFLRSSGRPLRDWSPNKRRAIAWSHTNTHSTNIEWLGTLPREYRVTLEGIDILLCHGAPSSAKEMLTPETSRTVFERQREMANARLILCGGSDEPFARQVEETLFVCPGGITGPYGARYAIVDTKSAPWAATFHEAPYDAALVQRRMQETGLSAPRDP